MTASGNGAAQALTDDLEKARRRFLAETEGHSMAVMHESGPYRHLRFTGPNRFYWFDIHTAPRILTVTGGMGTYVFRADEEDVLALFLRSSDVNPSYWSEKLKATDHASGHWGWDQDRFLDALQAAVDAWAAELEPDDAQYLRAAVEYRIEPYASSEHEALEAAAGFTFDGRSLTGIGSWQLHGHSHQYLFSCFAARHAAARYAAE